MKPINPTEVQAALQGFVDQSVYVHLETTTGAYAATPVSAFIRNASVRFSRATLAGTGPYRAGLQMSNGWIYAEGLTDWEVTPESRLLMAGHDAEGRLAIALELSLTPFPA
ncbi:MAG: YojF family protein [Mycobacterium leprae]